MEKLAVGTRGSQSATTEWYAPTRHPPSSITRSVIGTRAAAPPRASSTLVSYTISPSTRHRRGTDPMRKDQIRENLCAGGIQELFPLAPSNLTVGGNLVA